MTDHKFFCFVRQSTSRDEGLFARRLLINSGPLSGKIVRVRLRHATVPPPVAPSNEPPSAAEELGAQAEYDSVVELWLESSLPAACETVAEHVKASCLIGTRDVHVFHVTERAALTNNSTDERAPTAVNLIALLSWRSPQEEALARWSAHEIVALRVHSGASHYDRNIVLHSNCDQFPAVGGIVDFGFATLDDFQQRFWSSPAGAAEVAQDVAGFVKRADRLFLTSPVIYYRE
jgi:hypothetical protein